MDPAAGFCAFPFELAPLMQLRSALVAAVACAKVEAAAVLARNVKVASALVTAKGIDTVLVFTLDAGNGCGFAR